MIDRAVCTDCGVVFIYRRKGQARRYCLSCKSKRRAAKCQNYLSSEYVLH